MTTHRRQDEPQAGEEKDVSALFDELSKSISAFGVKTVIKQLRTKRLNLIDLSDESFAIVLNAVSNAFKIEPYDVIIGQSRKNGRKHALGMVIFFMYYHFDISMRTIALMVKKNIGNCTTYRKEIEQLNPQISSHKKLIAMKKQISEQLAKTNS